MFRVMRWGIGLGMIVVIASWVRHCVTPPEPTVRISVETNVQIATKIETTANVVSAEPAPRDEAQLELELDEARARGERLLAGPEALLPANQRVALAVSNQLCERMKVDIGSYYGKPQTLTTFVKPGGRWINSKYEDKQSTHYSFEMSCGNGGRHVSSRVRYGGFQAFGPKAQFADLFAYTIDGGQPVELVVVTDRSHENERTYTLLSWKPL